MTHEQTLLLQQHTVLLSKTARHFLELFFLKSVLITILVLLSEASQVLLLFHLFKLDPLWSQQEASVFIRIVSLQFKQYFHNEQHPTCLSVLFLYVHL